MTAGARWGRAADEVQVTTDSRPEQVLGLDGAPFPDFRSAAATVLRRLREQLGLRL